MDKIYNYQGDEIIVSGKYGEESYVKGVIHRGYNYASSGSQYIINNEDGAPENTIPAYILAANKGFKYVETDVAFTSDNKAVLLHDLTINRTSNGTGEINSMTLAQARSYTFDRFNVGGSHTIPGYSTTTIPTLEEFLDLCRRLSLHPYIELKASGNYTEAQIKSVVDMVEAFGMKGNVTYLSFDESYLGYVKNYDTKARLGYLRNDEDSQDYPLNATAITSAIALRTEENDVFISARTYTDSACLLCQNAKLPMETWGICYDDTEAAIVELNPYITGVTSNKHNAGKVLYKEAMD
jgi:glycerophosphoryl diester phosphodiesterase